MKVRRIIYRGNVQGVGFRYSVKSIARGFEVSGFVRNLADGTVELVMQGEPAEVDGMEKDVYESHLNGFIKEWEGADAPHDPSIRGFQIL